jgi:hypothetical protein
MNNVVRRASAFLTVGLLSLTGLMANDAAAQETEEGFPLTAFTAICEPGYLGVFEGCTPWEGVPVSFVALDQEFAETCFTAAGDRAASCTVNVPFGSEIVGSIMPSEVPKGYVLQGETALEFMIPDGPPEGVFGGPTSVLLPVEQAPVEAPVVDEPVVETPIGDEPVTDDPVLDTVEDTSGTVVSLPNTGVGTPTSVDASAAMTAALMMGTATVLAGGAAGLRRMRR